MSTGYILQRIKRILAAKVREGTRRHQGLAAFGVLLSIIAVVNTPSPFLYPLEKRIKFDRISVEEGLSQSSVSCILLDRRGWMWLGTEDGLNRYDGYTFTIYRHQPKNPSGLSHSNIYSLFQDREGRLWIGTEGGLNRWDPVKDSFVHFKKEMAPPFQLGGNAVVSLGEDRDGILWVGTADGGLNRYDVKEDKFIFLRHEDSDPHSLGSNHIRTLYFDSSSRLWIGTQDQGLDRWDNTHRKFIHYRHHPQDSHSLGSNSVTAIAEDREGYLWIGTGDGLHRLDPKTGYCNRYRPIPRNPRSIGSGEILCLTHDHEGNLLIGTGDGLNQFKPGEGTFSRWQNDPADLNSLSNNVVLSIYEDSSRVLWIGTQGGGLNKYAPYRDRFAHYRVDPLPPFEGLSGDIVYGIYEDRSGITWIGTNRGLNRWDRDTDTFTYYKTDPANPRSLSNNYVFSILEDRSGVMWVGTWGGGLNRFDRQTGSFIHYLSDPRDKLSLSNNIVTVIFEDRQGVIWIGTEGGGLNRWNRPQKNFSHYQTVAEDPLSPSNNFISSIIEDPSGVLWIGTRYGFNRFDRQTGAFLRYTADSDKGEGLIHNEVNAIYPDPSGVLWVGTAGGLDRFDPGTRKFIHYGESEGLPNNVIYGILADDDGNLWMSTNKGLSRFDPQRGSFRNYGTKDGLQSNEFNRGAFYKNRRGEMFFGGINGFNRFHPAQVKDNPHRPPIIITDLKIFHHPAGEETSPVPLPITGNTGVELSYRDRLLTFEYAALDFTSPSDNRYAYMMEGFDRDWIDVGTRRFASYTTLPQGEYLFKVRGANSDGVWNETGIALRIVVHPPFWQTWWFRGVAGLILLILFVIFYLVRTRTIRGRSKKLEEINEALNRQIAERNQAQEELKQTKTYLDNVFNSLSSMLISVTPEGVITQLNTAVENYIKAPAGELISGKVWEAIPFLQSYRDELAEVFRSRVPVELHRERIDIGKEEPRYLDIVVYPLVYEGLEGSVIRMDDVTESEKKDRQLIQAQKMETVGNLAGGLAHDFNNVLGGIVGTVSLLKYLLEKEKTVDLEKIKNSIMTIEKGSSRAVDLVNQLLTLSRKNEPLFISVDLNESLKEVIKICENTFDKSIKMDISYHTEGAMILADDTQIQQILLNLFVNASHAMTFMRKMDEVEGGTLSVSIRPFYADRHFCLSQPEAEEGKYWVLEVKDTGVGIDPVCISKIFDPFYTTKTKAQGTGLGLAMTYNIVQQHRGFIHVDSQPGRGTTFRVYFPQVEEQKYFFKEYLPLETLTRGSGVILVVDDEESLRLTLKEILEACGYHVLLASDGRQGIKIFKERCREIKLILLDVAMPNMAGRESYLEMKKIYPPVKVLLISGYKNDQRVKDIMDLGVNGFLPKPFSMVELSRKVAEMLRS